MQIVCPGFSADCLETLEEIGVENRGYFIGAGGEKYSYIPCLNSDPEHIVALTDFEGPDPEASPSECKHRSRIVLRQINCGAGRGC